MDPASAQVARLGKAKENLTKIISDEHSENLGIGAVVPSRPRDLTEKVTTGLAYHKRTNKPQPDIESYRKAEGNYKS